MERDQIITFALSQRGLSGDTYRRKISLLLNQYGVGYSSAEAWCAAFTAYCYFSCNVFDKVKFDPDTLAFPRNNPKIWHPWPSDSLSQAALLRLIKPADIIVWERKTYGHAGLILSVKLKEGATDPNVPANYIISTIEGNTYNDELSIKSAVDDKEYRTYPFTKSNNRHILGFVCPDLSGSGIAGISIGLSNNSFTVRDSLNRATMLDISKFNKDETNGIYAYYLSKKIGADGKLPGLNTCTSSNKNIPECVLPNMVAYCQGRAREVWDKLYLFTAVDELNTNVEDPSENILISCAYLYTGNKQGLYLSTIVYPQEGITEKIRSWEQLWNLSTLESFDSPFLSYKGTELKGPSAHLMVKQAIKNGMHFEPAYKLENQVLSLDRYEVDKKNLPIKNDNCLPQAGAIAVWAEDSALNTNKGYCAFVERTRADGLIFVSMSGRLTDRFLETFWLNPYCFVEDPKGLGNNILKESSTMDANNRRNHKGIYFLGYIYPPSSLLYSLNTYSFALIGQGVATMRIWVI